MVYNRSSPHACRTDAVRRDARQQPLHPKTRCPLRAAGGASGVRDRRGGRCVRLQRRAPQNAAVLHFVVGGRRISRRGEKFAHVTDGVEDVVLHCPVSFRLRNRFVTRVDVARRRSAVKHATSFTRSASGQRRRAGREAHAIQAPLADCSRDTRRARNESEGR